MKTNTDYLSIEELYNLDNRIDGLTDKMRNICFNFPEYDGILPYLKTGVFYLEIAEIIEKSIENLGLYLYKPIGWETSRKYTNGKNTISYVDFNRWNKNLTLIENAISKIDETIWNIYSNENWNSVNSSLEWEE